MLVLFDGWTSFFRDRVVPWRIGMAEKLRAQLETEVLPRYLAAQRWYGAQGRGDQARPARRPRGVGRRAARAGCVTLRRGRGRRRDGAVLPAARARVGGRRRGAPEARSRPRRSPGSRQQAQVGVLGDAFADEGFCRALVAGDRVAARARHARTARCASRRPRRSRRIAGGDVAALPVGRPQAQSSNTVVTLGERLFLKGYRRLRAGVNPELEVGRFLTEVAASRTASRSPARSNTSAPTARR